MSKLDINGKKVLVVGLGKSGIAASLLLHRHGAIVTATDSNPVEALSDEAKSLQALGIKIEAGGHRTESFISSNLIVLSPGVPKEIKPVAMAKDRSIMIISEIELAFSLQCAVLKFFPAESSGGIEMLKSLSAPYGHLGVRFVPTGGVNATNLEAYLAVATVAAVGGTWIAKKEDIAEGRWAEIRDRCKKAADIVAKVRG